MKKKLIAVLLVASMAASLVACGNKNSGSASNGSADSAPAEATAVNTDTTTLRINLASEPDYLDPALNSSVDGACLAVNSFVGLYTYDENNDCVPAIADGEPEVSEDGLTYTIKLKETKWSNGDALTANDFVYSWNRAVDEKTAADYAYMFAPIATNSDGTLKIEATDDYTLKVELNAPCAYFYDLLAFPTFMPVFQADVEKADPDGTQPGAWAQEPGFVSNGAFTLKEWKHNESMVYEKNPNYYRADEVKLEKLEFMLSADDTAIYAAYNSGDIDFADTVPNDEIQSLLNSPEFHVIDTLGTYYVGFNVNSDLFKGLTADQACKMRKALSLLIDRQYIVDTVGQTGQVPADTFIPDGMADGNGGIFEADDFGYYDATTTGAGNVEEAKGLLEECGYSFESDGNGGYKISPALEVTYMTNSGTGHEAIAQCIQQDWGIVGIDVKIETEDWNVFLEDRKAGKFDIAREGWIADFNDPINMLEMWLSTGGNNDMQLGKDTSNSSAPSWKEYDEHIQKIYATTDFAERVKLMREAEDMLMETSAVVPIYFYNDIYLQKTNVDGIYTSKNQNKYFMFAEKTAE
ncbi:oligopeptide transport system substrate-binding protein [Pseudobutyrivibrio sp. YE44]|uniref:peptide ABC transporter substrate-binding protein n=1 Tax=Pseudobutyrivibrio sp. YE44 TaxID=1520802 RepID=UPI000887D79D|nr:peptide ABC transporter substrate-binding protein [Pseudobutyrivibrio sp. YE44]SDB52660.1 oligopeptide transport system substrate-binding protein [Pseudobutyrivibrio sp. YE44]